MGPSIRDENLDRERRAPSWVSRLDWRVPGHNDRLLAAQAACAPGILF